MLKNIVFIVLFVLLYGGAYIMLSGGSELTDRNGYGELTETHYNCERFSMEMDFEPEWLVYDGVALKESTLDLYSQAEFESIYDCPMSQFAFIGGAANVDAEFYIMSYLNYNAPESEFNVSGTQAAIDSTKNTITSTGGVAGNAECRMTTLENGNKMLLYYYDYTINDTFYSTFYAFTNVGRDMVFIEGVYQNPQGLLMLTDFVENKLNFYSSTGISV